STPSRFAPGSIIAARYRLVALLGRAGMGEVYRADGLTVDQPVALKFLPEGVAADAARLAQFHNELPVPRQVPHKNVCRLYDLGGADGRRFLTSEYGLQAGRGSKCGFVSEAPSHEDFGYKTFSAIFACSAGSALPLAPRMVRLKPDTTDTVSKSGPVTE